VRGFLSTLARKEQWQSYQVDENYDGAYICVTVLDDCTNETVVRGNVYIYFRHFMCNSIWKNVYKDKKRKNKKIELRNHKF